MTKVNHEPHQCRSHECKRVRAEMQAEIYRLRKMRLNLDNAVDPPNPDYLRLHMGELTAAEVRIAQSAWRLGAFEYRTDYMAAMEKLRAESARLDWLEVNCGWLDPNPVYEAGGGKRYRERIGSDRASIDSAMEPSNAS